MKVHFKFKHKAAMFTMIIAVYFCLNYINLTYNSELRYNHLQQQEPNKPHATQVLRTTPNPTPATVQQPSQQPQTALAQKNTFICLERNRPHDAKETLKCGTGVTIDLIRKPSEAVRVDFEVFLDQIPLQVDPEQKKSYYLVYAMESEPHSSGGGTWHNADFVMYYHLDRSFPAPATYFDMNGFLPDLIAPPRVDFEDKNTQAPLVWVLSNCGAFNEREKYVSRLMQLIKVDSYGGCLRNRRDHTSSRMSGNIELYSKYKFVIAIENSNCEDYVTEKLVHAVASGSIPIVAGRDNKPDYLRFMPNGSFINIYDYKSVQDLAAHLTYLAGNRAAYEKYLRFKFGHGLTRNSFVGKPLQEVVEIAKRVIGRGERFFGELVAKEKSESKLCKVAKYLRETPQAVVSREIKARRMNRPGVHETCLPRGNLNTDLLVESVSN